MSDISVDERTVAGFGEEWSRFSFGPAPDLERVFEEYFRIFPWDRLPRDAVGSISAVAPAAGRRSSRRAWVSSTASTQARRRYEWRAGT